MTNKLIVVFDNDNDNVPINIILSDIAKEISNGHLTGKVDNYYHWDIL